MKTQNHTKQYKVGSIVLATDQGLGYLAKDFYDNGIIDVVYVHPHSSRVNHYDWYEYRVASMDQLLDICDVILLFETPFDWRFIVRAREKGVKTIFMPMYECTRYPLPYQPDYIISPSLLDQKYYPESEFVPVPVNVKHRLRKEAKVFIHNAGNGGLGGRNGTKELLEAMQYVDSPIKLIVRSQIPIEGVTDPRVFIRIGTVHKLDLWDEGDVFIFPEKFNGLSLPLQEAYASGMLVMCGDRFPMNNWLPNDPLIPVKSYKKENIAGIEFDSAVFDPKDIANTIDEWYNVNITDLSLDGRDWAMRHSWFALKERYLNIIKKVCEK